MDGPPRSQRPPVTLETALRDLNAAAERRRALPRGSAEYALAVAAELAISETVHELARALNVKDPSDE